MSPSCVQSTRSTLPATLLTLLAAIAFAPGNLAAQTPGNRVVVDQRSSPPPPPPPGTYRTLAAATAKLRPGDTLWIAPDSGPYREILYIKTNGNPNAPVTIEGNGNEITGFDTLAFSEQGSATLTTDYPFVLRHHGKRIPEDAATGKFTAGITWNPDAKTLTLAPDTSPEGWEISTRPFAVRINNASHHTYKNLIATGSRNDGFNLHGTGSNLLFENITGAQNLDEGFSAHETIDAEIRGGRFYENDNGLFNVQQSKLRLTDADLYNNLGLGLAFNGDATIEARKVRVWGNGAVQLLLNGTVNAAFENTVIHRQSHTTRPWLSYMEMKNRTTPTTSVIAKTVIWTGAKPTFADTTAPANTPTP
ncbi:right-handed parallel beta-helix repeat-containing protein [Opitutaceae bacterium TAV4]|nr:right-handed parallel beta-helix repeat-containing protein [Opitutaceae bacterium TAV4]